MHDYVFNLNNKVLDLLQLEVGLKSFQTINKSDLPSENLIEKVALPIIGKSSLKSKIN